MKGYWSKKSEQVFEEQRKAVMSHFGGWSMFEVIDFLHDLKEWVINSAKEKAKAKGG
jgi:hypothetical protein